MSFTDFGSGGAIDHETQSRIRSQSQRNSGNVSSNAPANLDRTLAEVGELLTKFQGNCNSTRTKVDGALKAPLSTSAKAEIDGVVKTLKNQSKQVSDKLDGYVRQVNELPREEAAARRVSAVKMQRDYDRVFNQYQAIIKDHSSIRVDRSIPTKSHNDTFSNAYDNSNAGQNNYQQQQQQQTVMHELVDVDDAIIEEREQDIRKINQDLHIVNEMFRDMAQIVEKQGGVVTKIEQDSEVSRERAQQGLAEVKQAAQYQPTCVIS